MAPEFEGLWRATLDHLGAAHDAQFADSLDVRTRALEILVASVDQMDQRRYGDALLGALLGFAGFAHYVAQKLGVPAAELVDEWRLAFDPQRWLT